MLRKTSLSLINVEFCWHRIWVTLAECFHPPLFFSCRMCSVLVLTTWKCCNCCLCHGQTCWYCFHISLFSCASWQHINICSENELHSSADRWVPLLFISRRQRNADVRILECFDHWSQCFSTSDILQYVRWSLVNGLVPFGERTLPMVRG